MTTTQLAYTLFGTMLAIGGALPIIAEAIEIHIERRKKNSR